MMCMQLILRGKPAKDLQHAVFPRAIFFYFNAGNKTLIYNAQNTLFFNILLILLWSCFGNCNIAVQFKNKYS